MTQDHDGIKVGNDAIGFNGSGANTIDLDNLSATVGGFNFEFDVLDVTKVTSSGLILNGGTDAAPVTTDPDETADDTDEVVLGALSKVTSINDFESMVMTDATVAAGTTFTFNPGADTITQGSTTVSTSANVLSFGGLVFEDTLRQSVIPDVATGVNVTIAGTAGATVHGGAGADTLTGAGLNDVLRGNGGNDTLDGGLAAEVRFIQINPTGTTGAAGTTITITLDGFVATLNLVAGAPVDVDANAGDNLDLTAGGGSNSVGAALQTLVNANLADINDGIRFGGQSLINAAYSNTTGNLTFTFAAGADVVIGDTIVVAGAGLGTVTVTGETVVTEGSNGGANTFVFEPTAAANGVDTINNFKVGATDDVLDFTAFLGAAGVLRRRRGRRRCVRSHDLEWWREHRSVLQQWRPDGRSSGIVGFGHHRQR